VDAIVKLDEAERLTDIQSLAIAVLENDYSAALALADEVTLQHTQGTSFVSRQDLKQALKPFSDYADDVDLHSNHHFSDDAPIGMNYGNYTATLTLGQCRQAAFVLEKCSDH
jgi:hypothetical protein